MTVSVTVDKVDVTLGHNHVLKQVSLDVKEGEFVTLLGASGSGKSTLLNVIAGLQEVDSGHVAFAGKNIENYPPQKRGVGVVFQSYALFPHLTVAENVAFPLKAHHRSKAEQASVAQEMLALVHLSEMSDRKPAQLSGGQRQRVALARALAANPAVLLLDEPMAALDKQLREQMQVEIKRIQQRVGITTIAVTHDQTEAFTMSDRVAIMHNGSFVQVGTPVELYHKPANEYVATFLGEANLFSQAEGVLLGAPGQPGSQGTAVIRPEDLQPLHPSEAPKARLEATIRLVSFQGDRFRIEAETAAGQTVVSSLPGNADMTPLQPGSLIPFGCRNDTRIHVIPPSASVPTVEDELSVADHGGQA